MRSIHPDEGTDSALFTVADASRARRIQQVAGFTGLVLAVRIGGNVLMGTAFNATQAELSAGLGMVLLTLWLCRRNHLDSAGMLLIASLTAMASSLIWSNEGLHDTALLTFPGLLIFSGLLTPLRVFYGLLLYMVTFIIVMAWRTSNGLHVTTLAPSYSDYQRAFDQLLILAVSGLSIQMLITDLHKALQKSRKAMQALEQSQADLTYLAQHDVLTGLPNRRMGRDHITQALHHARRQGRRVALLFVDVDNFKDVNDAYGHDFGDHYLKHIADRLRSAVREVDIVSRQGGDEFVIGITDVQDPESAAAVAEKILKLLREPVSHSGQGVFTSCSIGIALSPDDGDDFDALLQRADQAMYRVKNDGRNGFCFGNRDTRRD